MEGCTYHGWADVMAGGKIMKNPRNKFSTPTETNQYNYVIKKAVGRLNFLGNCLFSGVYVTFKSVTFDFNDQHPSDLGGCSFVHPRCKTHLGNLGTALQSPGIKAVIFSELHGNTNESNNQI